MSKGKWLGDKIDELDDEAFIEVMDRATTRSANADVRFNDEVVHVSEMADVLEEVRKTKGKFKGFSTGYSTLDEKMGGMEAGSVILVGGETSNGKSALATNIAVNVAKEGVGVLYISLEMTQKQMLERLDTIAQGDPLGMNLLMQKSFQLGYKDLEPLLQRAKRQSDIQIVVLDYLQYLGRGMTLDEVARMSKEIKSLALRYNIAFMVIVSLRKSDNKFKRKWVDIEIEELMGTAAIGYDADVAMVVSRKDKDNDFQDDKVFVKILKTRNTRLDYNDRIVELEWDRTRITEAWHSPSFPGAKLPKADESWTEAKMS